MVCRTWPMVDHSKQRTILPDGSRGRPGCRPVRQGSTARLIEAAEDIDIAMAVSEAGERVRCGGVASLSEVEGAEKANGSGLWRGWVIMAASSRPLS